MKKADQRVLLTKRLLQEGLLRLLERKDMDKINVSELCAEAGINRATFYRHYGQPRDILYDLRQEILQDVQALADKNHAEEHPLAWLEDTCRYFQSRKDHLLLLFKTRTDDDFVEVIQQLYTRQLHRFRSHTGEANEHKAKLMAYGYAGSSYYILRQWILEPIPLSPKDIAVILYGFLNT